MNETGKFFRLQGGSVWHIVGRPQRSPFSRHSYLFAVCGMARYSSREEEREDLEKEHRPCKSCLRKARKLGISHGAVPGEEAP